MRISTPSGAVPGAFVWGWLGDKIGRVRAMSLSIFTYAIFTGLCGFASEAWHIAVFPRATSSASRTSWTTWKSLTCFMTSSGMCRC